jgi:hypothetical protein
MSPPNLIVALAATKTASTKHTHVAASSAVAAATSYFTFVAASANTSITHSLRGYL